MGPEGVFKVIDGRLERHLAEVQRFVRVPSVSATGEGIAETAEMVADKARSVGADVDLVRTGGNPIVAGRLDAGARRTLIFYDIYDVQPAEHPGWLVPPFSGSVIDLPGVGPSLVSRGAFNSKGPLIGFLNVLESFRNAEVPLPVNLRFLIEGEEEIGSPSLRPFMETHRSSYAGADAAYVPFFGQDLKGKPIIYLGVKGLVYVELTCRGGQWGGPTTDAHGQHAAWVHSPVARLIHALAGLVDRDGTAQPGWLPAEHGPTAEDEDLLRDLARTFDPEAQRGIIDAARFKFDDPLEALRSYLFKPSVNIDGIWAGYTGEGIKTVLPATASTKVHVRLVMGMRTGDVIEAIRRRLDSQGFGDVEIEVLAQYSPYKMSRSEPVIRALVEACQEQAAAAAELWPLRAGAGPLHLFPDVLGVPLAFGGIGSGGRAHSVNEYITVDGLRLFERGVASFLSKYGSE
jgi:acetylornithine deacetylase/succinyl-diaminopimelate desuccinylase-like protein